MELRAITAAEVPLAMGFIDAAKAHLKEQGIDQWQTGYPDKACIEQDAETGKGFFFVEGDDVLGYTCIDFEGEPAYADLSGAWAKGAPYVVVHRMAFGPLARGKRLSGAAFALVEAMAAARGVRYFRVDTDAANEKMQHVLQKCGFCYRGTILFDNSEKIAFDKEF